MALPNKEGVLQPHASTMFQYLYLGISYLHQAISSTLHQLFLEIGTGYDRQIKRLERIFFPLGFSVTFYSLALFCNSQRRGKCRSRNSAHDLLLSTDNPCVP